MLVIDPHGGIADWLFVVYCLQNRESVNSKQNAVLSGDSSRCVLGVLVEIRKFKTVYLQWPDEQTVLKMPWKW